MKWFFLLIIINYSSERIENLFKRASKWRVGNAILEVEAARDTLIKMGDSVILKVLSKHIKTQSLLKYRALKSIMREKHPLYMDALRAYTLSPNDTIKISAIYLAGELKDTQSLPNIVNSLEDTSLRIRLNAFLAIGKIGDTAYGQYLCKALNSEEVKEVLVALSSISKMGYSGCVSAVYQKIHEEGSNSFVRYAALFAISSMKDTVFSFLRKRLINDMNFYDLTAFYELINKIKGIPQRDTFLARSIFKKAMKSRDSALRILAVRGLCRLSGKNVLKDFLFDEVDESVRFEIERCLKN